MRTISRFAVCLLALGEGACGGDASGDPCGVGDFDPKGSAAHPTAHALGSQSQACMGASSEVHAYQFSAPADSTGGYVQGTVTGIAEGTVLVKAYAGSETVELATFASAAPGAAVTFFVAVAPGESYRLAIANQGAFGGPYPFNLASTYTPVADGFEPNDSLAAALPIAINVPMQAYLFAGRVAADDETMVYDDYYRFDAASGSATIRIDDVPTDLAPRITLYAADGSELARVSSGLKGTPLVMHAPVLAAPSALIVLIAPWSGAPASTGTTAVLPDHFTRPYTLTISQP